jgi:hypothetical protein
MDGFNDVIALSFHRVIDPPNIDANTPRDNTNVDDDDVKLPRLYT